MILVNCTFFETLALPIGLAENGCDATDSNIRGSTSAILFAYSIVESTERNRLKQANNQWSKK